MPPDYRIARRHRKQGPILTFLGVSGFFTDMLVAYLNCGRLLRHSPHFSAGLMIAFCLFTVYFISRNINGPHSSWRMPHFVMGLLVISLYCVQVFLGIRILFRQLLS